MKSGDLDAGFVVRANGLVVADVVREVLDELADERGDRNPMLWVAREQVLEAALEERALAGARA
jgi:hypothetical protein